MSGSDTPPLEPEPAKLRQVNSTEHSWCRAVPGGTGTTVLVLLLTKPPDISLLQTSLHTLQTHHPLLRSLLHLSSSSFSLLIPSTPSLTLHSHSLQSISHILHTTTTNSNNISAFQKILEHEMNHNPWENPDSPSTPVTEDTPVMYAGVYEVEEGNKWTLVIKLHTGVCDRTGAVEVMRELMVLMRGGGGTGEELKEGMEEYVPAGKSSKPFWARGVNMLGYSLNSFRLSNLEFVGPSDGRTSRVVRLLLDAASTTKLLEGCRTRAVKLCGALSAAGLIAARLSKGLSDGVWEKYAVVTLVDCRNLLEPPLSNHNVGFYHSAILNTHDMQGGEDLWELARRTYKSFQDAKNSNKHFTDMADLNFLMCKAIENPGLTPSSSLRTSFISVWEDPVIDETDENYKELGVEDYLGCASVHGVGPSIAIFDTIRDGKLDCVLVYPFPLHSREQMQEFTDTMQKILIDC